VPVPRVGHSEALVENHDGRAAITCLGHSQLHAVCISYTTNVRLNVITISASSRGRAGWKVLTNAPVGLQLWFPLRKPAVTSARWSRRSLN